MKITVAGKFFESWRACCKEYGTNYHTFINRVHNCGWDRARAATEPVETEPLLELDGESHTIAEWARRYKVSVESTYKRLQRGNDLRTALTATRRVLRITAAERSLAKKTQRKKLQLQIASKIRKYKARPCTDCKMEYTPEAMEFDHCRGTKLFNLSRPPRSLPRIAAEIAKCDVVCAICHRTRTRNRRSLTLYA